MDTAMNALADSKTFWTEIYASTREYQIRLYLQHRSNLRLKQYHRVTALDYAQRLRELNQ